MNKYKIYIPVIAGALAAVLTFSNSFLSVPMQVAAEGQKSSGQIKSEISTLKDRKKDIDAQISELENQIAENNGEIENLVANKNIIEQEIFLLHEQINTLNEQITSHSALIADHQLKLDEAENNLAALNAKNKQRIQAMEESGGLSYWSVLFKANSFSDLLDRLVMMDDIASSDQRRLDEMREAAAQVRAAKETLEEEKEELDQSREDLKAAEEEAQGKRAEADAILNELLATGVEYQELLNESAAKTDALMDEISQLDAQYDEAKKREYEEWLAQQKPVEPPKPTPQPDANPNTPAPEPEPAPNVDGATWLVPVNYIQVSSPFGYRVHPIYGTVRLHAGIDLAAATGTPIIASRSGTVTTAAYEEGGAGYYVSINHFDGYSTRYMHMTHYIVSAGQQVQAGQVIGYVGSTGASTGPHLHFGVYYNGTPINPAPFIGL